MHITQILQSVNLSIKGEQNKFPAIAYKPAFQVFEGNSQFIAYSVSFVVFLGHFTAQKICICCEKLQKLQLICCLTLDLYP